MDAQNHLRLFNSEMLPITRRHDRLLLHTSWVVFECVQCLFTLCRVHGDATDMLVLNLLDRNLPDRLTLRQLPCSVRVLFAEDRRAGAISKLDLD